MSTRNSVMVGAVLAILAGWGLYSQAHLGFNQAMTLTFILLIAHAIYDMKQSMEEYKAELRSRVPVIRQAVTYGLIELRQDDEVRVDMALSGQVWSALDEELFANLYERAASALYTQTIGGA